MIKVYKTQPFEAEQFDGSNWMVDRLLSTDYVVPNMGVDDETDSGLLLATTGGFIELTVGDWIVSSTAEEHILIKDKDFNESYRQLPVIPKYVADWIEECKDKHISIGDMLCSERRPEKVRDWMAFTPGTYKFDYARYRKYQELIANAWLNGYQLEMQSD